MSWTIPLTDLEITDADVDAVMECLESGWLTMGPRTAAFEAAFAELCGVEHAVAVSSGTAALHLALLAAGIGPGDEVLVPALTFVAAAATVRYCGATPVFVDSLGPHDLNLDPEAAARLVTPRTRAVLATHWMGYACDLEALGELCDSAGLALLEDCAQSVTATDRRGRMTGTVGTAGCFSFFSKKQLAVGEGGMVISSDAGLAAKVRSLRSHAMTSVTWDRHRGHADAYDVVDIGFNYRIDEPRAALGLSRLPRLTGDVERRRALARRYRELLADAPGLTVPWSDDEVERAAHFGFTVLLSSGRRRTEVERELDAVGIQTTCYPALPTLTAYRDHRVCPIATDLASRHLLLPLAACFELDKVEAVVQRLLGLSGGDGATKAA